jgi:hypothetical protein
VEMKSALADCTANATQTAPMNSMYLNNFMFIWFAIYLIVHFRAPPEQVDRSSRTLGQGRKKADVMPIMNTIFISP